MRVKRREEDRAIPRVQSTASTNLAESTPDARVDQANGDAVSGSKANSALRPMLSMK